MIDVDRPLLTRAFQPFSSVEEGEPSLTDCTSFAVMEKLEIRRVLTFDQDFRATGAQRLG